MANQHPITPTPELVQQWLCSDDYLWGPLEQASITITTNRLNNVANQAAQWGSDQELEACCEWLTSEGLDRFPMRGMREARRPKPPSLKEQALSEVAGAVAGGNITPERGATIRRALEQLPDAL